MEHERECNVRARVWLGMAVLMASVCTLILTTSCEDVTTDTTIRISPDAPEVNRNEVIVLTAALASGGTNNLFLPLEWSVSDPTLGTVVGRAGDTAVYQAGNRTGNNVIKVRDQTNNEGVTSVRQL